MEAILVPHIMRMSMTEFPVWIVSVAGVWHMNSNNVPHALLQLNPQPYPFAQTVLHIQRSSIAMTFSLC